VSVSTRNAPVEFEAESSEPRSRQQGGRGSDHDCEREHTNLAQLNLRSAEPCI